MSAKQSKSFLDIDSSILEDNLRFVVNPAEEELNKLFPTSGDHIPSKLVKPFPGFCIKTREIGSDAKFFVNICHTDSIPPPPKDLTERELNNILDSDEISDYRVPMSIGDIRTETDKKGEEARVSDVAIHPDFFKKIEQSQLFKSFFITIVFEGLKEKHGVICHDEKIILKNRKAFGTLQTHRIQQREIDAKMKPKSSLIEEIQGDNKSVKPLIETISSNEIQIRTPEYRLYRKKDQPSCLIGEFQFPDIFSSKELTVDVGEDRIVIEASSKHYLLDIFVPFFIRQASVASTFNTTTKVLTVTMPLVGG